MKRILIFTAFLMVLFSYNVNATCSRVAVQTTTSSLGNTIVQRDAPIGSVINTLVTPTATYYGFDCTGMDTFGLYLDYSSTLSSQGEHIYDTNVAGVGIRMFNGGTNGKNFDNPQSTVQNSQTEDWAYDGATIQLIKTGDIKSGELKSGTIGTVRLLGYDTNYHDGVYIKTTGGTVTQLACTITTPSLTFPIGTVPLSEFGSTVGFTAKETNSQNLGLNCDKDANINVSLNGTQNPDVSTTSVLALTGQGDSGTAKGVGIQLLYNDTPLEINKNIVMKKSAGGQELLPIVARYYQTKSTVTPGDASTSATLSLTYQ
ncbi:fimbrial protein [Enterobacteriaceae bacterium RIT714]|nr:fimbrial protein [Enterobacteriaceae bacterium RIT714]